MDLDNDEHNPTLYVVDEQLERLQRFIGSCNAPVSVPLDVKSALDLVLSHLSETRVLGPSSPTLESAHLRMESVIPNLCASPNVDVQRNKAATRETTLDYLYTYRDTNALIEYPATGVKPIGHLFGMDPRKWANPARNIVYSQGEPKGTAKNRKSQLLVDNHGKAVQCRVTTTTCQGVKLCPYFDKSRVEFSHTSATREALSKQIRALNVVEWSPRKELLHKTLTYFGALHLQGCSGKPLVHGLPAAIPELARQRDLISRGHTRKEHCEGELIFQYDASGKPLILCQFYNRHVIRDHYIDYNISNELYDLSYLEALFLNDQDAISEHEEELEGDKLHSGGSCLSISNVTAVKPMCPSDHRGTDGKLVRAEMQRLECGVKFRIFEPDEEFRTECPWILIICEGIHIHPIPIPSKTPPVIRSTLSKLMNSLCYDMPDLTPRRFIRHPSTQQFLATALPGVVNPVLSDIHPSLANRDHLRGYIDVVRRELFPQGTGWAGLLHRKTLEDESLPPEHRYIRFMAEIPAERTLPDDSENDEDTATSVPLRIAICMTQMQSIRLSKARYLQSDISFKRVIGFMEFELGALDRESRTIITYCRVYLNSQSAQAHHRIFKEIDRIVEADTGSHLQWRHLHSENLDVPVGIYQIAIDQHGGQAKGLGLYLKQVASRLPVKSDLHCPDRTIQSLTEYEHLHRLVRLCANHFLRNITNCAVSEHVRNMMRSLRCLTHPNWESTLQAIEDQGGTAGKNWLNDKLRSKFALQAICWEMSLIPKSIWQVGDETSNIVESLHYDVYREVISCTLLGGVQKGHSYDILKLKTLETLAEKGIRPSYSRGHLSESISRGIKRKGNAQHKQLEQQDERIDAQNKRLRLAADQKFSADLRYSQNQKTPDSAVLTAATKAKKRADEAYDKALLGSFQLAHSGSGKTGLLLPALTREESQLGASSSQVDWNMEE